MPTSLAIALDRASREPLYRQVERQLRLAIADRRLRPGTLLPGVRTLASQLGVARITIVTAYEQLASEGLLDARIGSGTRVAVDAADSGPDLGAMSRPPLMPTRRFPARVVTSTPPRPIDLRPGGLRVDDGPAATWESLLRGAWRELTDATGSARPERDPAGDPLLRAAIAERVGLTRGIACTPDEVVITAGRRAGLAVLAELLVPPGGIAVVEDPADPRALAVLEGAGARLVPVPADARGLRTDLLPRSGALVRVTPAWQESTGATMSLDRRLDLLAWAEGAGATVIEDDPAGEFRLRGAAVPALRALERGGGVVTLEGLDEQLFDGVALGSVVAPRALAGRIAARLDLLGRTPGALEQRAFAHLLAGGHFDRHLRRLRQRLRERQAALLEAISEHGEGLLRTGPSAAGRHLVVTVTDPTISARTAAARAVREGVLVESLAAHRRHGGADRDLLIGYSTELPERIREGVRRLVAAMGATGTRPCPTRGALPVGAGRSGATRVRHAGPIVPRLVVALE